MRQILNRVRHGFWVFIAVVLVCIVERAYADNPPFWQSETVALYDYQVKQVGTAYAETRHDGAGINTSLEASGTRRGDPVAAFSYGPGEVILLWTAPGDDGSTGRASGYDVRYMPVEFGPIDTESKWQQSNQFTGEPSPSRAGATDSMVVGGLDFGAYFYFSIKAFDNAANYSALSNSPLVAAGDTLPTPELPGDANGDGIVNGTDVVYLVQFFKGWNPPPNPLWKGDANGNCRVNGIDVVYLVNYLKRHGPAPRRGDCSWAANR